MLNDAQINSKCVLRAVDVGEFFLNCARVFLHAHFYPFFFDSCFDLEKNVLKKASVPTKI